MIDVAVKNSCIIFLEEVWESQKKYGNVKKYFGTKIGFINYLKPMITYKKLEMASEAIKYWEEVYKEEGIFDYLLDNEIEELLM